MESRDRTRTKDYFRLQGIVDGLGTAVSILEQVLLESAARQN